MAALKRAQTRKMLLLTYATLELIGLLILVWPFLLLPSRKLFSGRRDGQSSLLLHTMLYQIHVGELLLYGLRDHGHSRPLQVLLIIVEQQKHMNLHVVPLHLALVPPQTSLFSILVEEDDARGTAKLEPLDASFHEWKHARCGKQNSKDTLLTERVVHEAFHGIHACASQFAMNARHGVCGCVSGVRGRKLQKKR